MNIQNIYDDFFINLTSFLDDIKTIPIYLALHKDNRMLYFGFFLIILAIILSPLLK